MFFLYSNADMSDRGVSRHNRRGRNHSTRGQHQPHQERPVITRKSSETWS